MTIKKIYNKQTLQSACAGKYHFNVLNAGGRDGRKRN